MPRRKKEIKQPEVPAAALSNDDKERLAQMNYDLASLYTHTSQASCDDGGSRSVSRSARNKGPNGLDDRFKEINCSLQPFPYGNSNWIPAYDTVDICIKAYWAFGLLRQVVETMAELASSRVYLKGGSKKTREFIEVWMDKVKMRSFTSRFFREYWRSGNCAIWEQIAKIKKEDLTKLETLYSGMGDEIPLKYSLINPRILGVRNSLFFDNPDYALILTGPQVNALKHAETDGTEEDKAIYLSLDEKTKKELKTGSSIKLDKEHLTMIFYKAQDYEPWGVPLTFPVLEQINAHLELQRIDMAVARTTDRLLLLITMGKEATEADKFTINKAAMEAVQQMFNTNAINRTLVADYTTKGEWLVPPIDKILGAEKYETLEKQIAIGLNAIFFNENEKFANASIKVQIFIEKLKEARDVFLEAFLQPQINKICKIINAKSAPKAHFEDIGLKDDLQWAKVTAQLYSLGVLTAEEALENIQTGKFPSVEESLESQEEFKILKEEGLYTPVVGNSVEMQKQQAEVNEELGRQQLQQKQAQSGEAGRPTGSKAPQSTKNVSPIGASTSFEELKQVTWAVSDLQDNTDAALKKKYKVTEFDEYQTKMSRQLVQSIMANEERAQWKTKIKEYIKNPKEMNKAAAAEIDELCIAHDIDSYAASMLRLAIIRD